MLKETALRDVLGAHIYSRYIYFCRDFIQFFSFYFFYFCAMKYIVGNFLSKKKKKIVGNLIIALDLTFMSCARCGTSRLMSQNWYCSSKM